MTNKLETINIGIFGHIDHGKTTLLKQLSGKWADTHSEELKRGITIKLGYADITIFKDGKNYNTVSGVPVRYVSFIDAPGHEMLMATTLSGATLIDAAILVVAANEGIKPQTYEHLMTLQAKKVKQLIVVQNKIDLVDKERARKNYLEIKQLLGKEYQSAKIIPVCALQGVNIEEILKAIVEIPIPKRDVDSKPIFAVARSFDINRPGVSPNELNGAVLGGSLLRGRLRLGDLIEIKPGRVIVKDGKKIYYPLKTKILSLYLGSKKQEELTPGGSMSIETSLDMSLAKNDGLGGNLVSTVGNLPSEVEQVKIKFSLFSRVFGISSHMEVEKIKIGEMLMLSINTFITGGNVVSARDDEMVVNLKVPIIVFKGDNVGISRNIKEHWRLVGYGEIL